MVIYTDMAMSRSLEILSVDATLRDCVFRSSQPYRLVLPFGQPAFYKSYSSLNLQKKPMKLFSVVLCPSAVLLKSLGFLDQH